VARARNDKPIPKSSMGTEVKTKAPVKGPPFRGHGAHVNAARQEIIDTLSVPYSSPSPLKSKPLLSTKPNGAIIALVRRTMQKNVYLQRSVKHAHASITACCIFLARAKVKGPCKRR
jgi:hypothetical protein